MFKTIIDAKPDWQTFYPPEIVGEYLSHLWAEFDYNDIQTIPGAYMPTPRPSLDGFLMWYANRKEQNE
jgi:hypothetical protein